MKKMLFFINKTLGKDLLTILSDNLRHERHSVIQLSVGLFSNRGNTWTVLKNKAEEYFLPTM